MSVLAEAWLSIPIEHRNMLQQRAKETDMSLQELIQLYITDRDNSGENTPHRNNKGMFNGSVY